MLCSNCKKNTANFYYKYKHGNETVELHLCEECAKKMGYITNDSITSDFSDILSNFFTFPVVKSNVISGVKCEKCGETYEEFKKTGKLGCPGCYEVFSDTLDSVIGNIQSSTSHKGKIPGDKGEEIAKSKKINALKQELQRCILDEKYEKAAELRDVIKSLENGGEE